MKFTALFTVASAFVPASGLYNHGRDSTFEWAPPGPDDLRGPCPMMNSLANHGFLPRDGRNVTLENAVFALNTGLNFHPDLATVMFHAATVANPEPNATFFTLGHLNRHNVLEHDASMSRLDAHFGNNHLFNQEVFDETTAYWTAPVLDAKMLANGKLIRQINSRAANPDYTFTRRVDAFSTGEVAAPLIVFGDLDTGTAPKALVEYFFQNERLPYHLGWSKSTESITLQRAGLGSEIIHNATSLLTDGIVTGARERRDLHSGLYH
ncbi:Chloroperoxidase [Xylaria grammica]|nr:Chloroperoxidase [Xylaria grammica]